MDIDDDDQPSTHGANGNGGQDSRGRFLPGNRLAKGNPLAGRAAKIRAVLLEKLTPEDAADIADVLIAMAKNGNLPATRELLDRTVGRPSETAMVERIEQLESLLKGAVDREHPNKN